MSKFLGRAKAYAEGHKILTTMLVGIVPLMILAELFPVDDVQLAGIMVSLPVSLLFIAAYLPERPGNHWFGTSLLALAYGVVLISLVAAMVRLFGPQPWYQYLVTAWINLTFVALVGRTWVLIDDQWQERRHFGGWLRARREGARHR